MLKKSNRRAACKFFVRWQLLNHTYCQIIITPKSKRPISALRYHHVWMTDKKILICFIIAPHIYIYIYMCVCVCVFLYVWMCVCMSRHKVFIYGFIPVHTWMTTEVCLYIIPSDSCESVRNSSMHTLNENLWLRWQKQKNNNNNKTVWYACTVLHTTFDQNIFQTSLLLFFT